MSGEKWTDRDHLVATYLYRYGTAGLGLTLPEAAERLARSDETILKRFENYRYIDTKGDRGLAGWSPEKVAEAMAPYQALSQQEHLRLVRKELELDPPSSSGTKSWTDDELIIAIHLYRFGWEDLGVPYAALGEVMGRKPSTIVFRMANFLSFDGIETGLDHGGKHAQEVYEQYRMVPRDLLRTKAVQALLNLSSQKGVG